MENKTFYLVRHGLATHSTTGYGDKVYTAELLPEGIASIERLAAYLQTVPTDMNASSELIRCRQTAAIITKATAKTFVFDSRLNEYWPGSKEPFILFHDRIQNFLDELKTKKEKQILIVTHGAGIAAIKSFVLKKNFAISQLFDYPKTGALVIIKEGNIETIDFN